MRREDLYARLPLTAADRWWCELAASSVDGRVLELGAGAGRLSLALADAGAHVLAVEHDPRMRERLRERVAATGADVEVVDADATDVAAVGARGPVGLVLAPSSLLNEVPDGTARAGVLRAAAAACHPDGVVGLHLLGPWWLARSTGTVAGRLVPTDGAPEVAVTVRFGALAIDGRRAAELGYVFADGAVASDVVDAAVVTPGELDGLLAAAGLREVERWGGQRGRPPAVDDPAWHVLARPAAG